MTSEGLGEMFEGDSADMCAVTFPVMLMGGQAEGLVCADPGARTPNGVSGNFVDVFTYHISSKDNRFYFYFVKVLRIMKCT